MSTILAIDPGNTESGWVVIDAETCKPLAFGKTNNLELLGRINTYVDLPGSLTADHIVIEMVASYGMAVGAEVFDTCVWIGRFFEAYSLGHGKAPELVKRQPVRVHHCHSTKAKDTNVTQALVDRFTPGQRNFGKGTKDAPGFFYGFAKDIWQAYALAVYAADRLEAAA